MLTVAAAAAQVIPRSVLLADFEEAGAYLLCALGDGQLHNFKLDAATGVLPPIPPARAGDHDRFRSFKCICSSVF